MNKLHSQIKIVGVTPLRTELTPPAKGSSYLAKSALSVGSLVRMSLVTM